MKRLPESFRKAPPRDPAIALDCFGIYGVRGKGGEELRAADLDECHGHTHKVKWDGEKVKMFHYHFTDDFPYDVGCFWGDPAQVPRI